MQHSCLRQHLKRFALRKTNNFLICAITHYWQLVPIIYNVYLLQKHRNKWKSNASWITWCPNFRRFWSTLLHCRFTGPRLIKRSEISYHCSYNIQKIQPIWSIHLGFMYRAVLCQFCCITPYNWVVHSPPSRQTRARIKRTWTNCIQILHGVLDLRFCV
jgi:hypothetical protein